MPVTPDLDASYYSATDCGISGGWHVLLVDGTDTYVLGFPSTCPVASQRVQHWWSRLCNQEDHSSY